MMGGVTCFNAIIRNSFVTLFSYILICRCKMMGHLISLSSCQTCWKLKGHAPSCNLWNSSHDVGMLSLQVDFMHWSMSDHHTILDVGCCQWINIVCLPISRSAGWDVNFIGWLDDRFEMSDDGSMVLMTNLWGWRRSTDIMPVFKKFYRQNGRKMMKIPKNWVF